MSQTSGLSDKRNLRAHLCQRHIWHNDGVQCTWSIFRWLVPISAGVILVFEILASVITFRASNLPWHAPLGHTNTGFGRGGGGLTAWAQYFESIRDVLLWGQDETDVKCTKIETSEAEGASHDSQEDLDTIGVNNWIKIVDRREVEGLIFHTYNSGSLFAAFFKTLSEVPDFVAVSAALDAALPNFPATRPTAADMISFTNTKWVFAKCSRRLYWEYIRSMGKRYANIELDCNFQFDKHGIFGVFFKVLGKAWRHDRYIYIRMYIIRILF